MVLKAMGREDILTDPRFSDPAKLAQNRPQLTAMLDEIFGSQPMSHWYGVYVYSGEVEAVIYGHPAVREVAVFGVPDPQWGELVMAYVVLKPDATLTADDLIAFLPAKSSNL